MKLKKEDNDMNKDINGKNFFISQEHSISYEKHSQNKLNNIKNETKSINEIKKNQNIRNLIIILIIYYI